MNNSERMRQLINLAMEAEQPKPEILNENPVKNFARWGKLSEAWPGEPASEESKVTVYQDKDPLGTGEWFWLRSKDGHVVASGSAPSEEEAHAAANMKEDMLVAPELDEGGKMNAAWTAGMPPFSEEEQHALAGYKAGGGPQEGVHEFVASLRDGTAYNHTEALPLTPDEQARVDHFLANMKDPTEECVQEDVAVVHLLRPRGGAECGADCEGSECTPEINNVTCPACHKGHDEYTKRFDEGADLDEMFQQVHEEGPEVDTVTGPAYWASYLVNGDSSGMEDDEIAAADAWNNRLGDWYVVGIADDEETGESQESRFSNSYDIHSGTDTRGGDVVDYIVHKSHEPITEEDGGGLHVDYDLSISDLPEECIDDCSRGGQDAGPAVDYWRKKLNFTVDRDRALQCLKGYGAWEPEELAEMDDDELADKILWLACSNFSEWDGTENSNSGSDIFVLESKLEEAKLSVPDQHQKKIAIKSLKMNDVGADVMGIPKSEARAFLKNKCGYTDKQIAKLES